MSTTRQPVPVEGVRQAAPQVVTAPQSPKTPPVAVTGARSGGAPRASTTAGPSTPANAAATERAAAPTGGTETPSEVTKPPVGSIATPGSESRGPIVGHRKRSRRRAAPVLAATAVLAVATASGYVLNQNPGQSGGPTAPAAEVALPPESSIDPALPPLPDPFPVDPASADPEADPDADPTADPGSPAPTPSGTAPAGSPPEAGGTPGPAGSPPSPATGGDGRPVAPPPVSRTSDRPAAQNPAPPAATTMPGRVNSSGRNLALGGVANASSVEVNAVWDARYAIDGNTESRWSSAFGSDPQWIAVDLGDVWQVTQVRLLWERAYATAYRIEVSTDGRTWRAVYRTTTGAGGSVTVAVPRSPVRYVRVVGTARALQGYGYSLHEIEVR
ncbi:discoidin domain-containing protein [Micromonospora sp. NPDC000207]|uniref:discoidin domain-containing protein n=1 Tax=Micromonospora sp. NPDC000207 TaxID=3154246 RepID=UPI0033255035